MPLFLFGTAVRSLAQHKGRSLLTILSIIVGIAAVVATLAIGKGAEEKIRRRINGMGTNMLFVHVGNNLNTGATTQTKKTSTHWLRMSDLNSFKALCPQITHISPVHNIPNKLVRYNNKRIIAPITGCASSYFHIGRRQIGLGRLFTPQDEAEHANVVVLGSDAALELFKGANPLGKTLMIKKIPFTVVGVLQEAENFTSFRNKNMELYVPFSTSKRKLTKMPLDLVSGLALSVGKATDLEKVERSIRRALRNRHSLQPGEPDDFTIWNQHGMAQAAQESSSVFNLFLFIVASLSLLVGGIGVMNIMLVSVTERTKEIGIRMALGAPPPMILYQFLIESVLLCCVGGIIGIGLGVSVPVLVSSLTGWEVIVSPGSVLMALVITTAIGVFFGYWPARKASRLAIVEALIDR
ncbi:MAG: ABC transporter permease [Candidatus Dependentiae bacterium]